MTKLHGIWLSSSQEQTFFIWGETWRSCEGILKSDLPQDHPFLLSESELSNLLVQQQISRDQLTNYSSQSLTLPTEEIKKKSVLPLLSQQTPQSPEKVSFQTWQVWGYRLPIASLFPLLSTTTESASIKFWSHLFRWSDQLLARSKLLPQLEVQPQGKAITAWQPLFDAPIDQERLQTFAQQMPESCRSYNFNLSPEAIIIDFLSAVINTRIRDSSTPAFPPVTTPLLKQWFLALSSDDSSFSTDEVSLRRLEKALKIWIAPVENYLGKNYLETIVHKPFRPCFRLLPPSESNENWYLEYGLQSRDDEENFLDAETIWNTATDEIIKDGKTIKQPQETLLQGLGLALRLYPTIHDSLQHSTPTGCSLDPIQAYEFIRASAWRLSENGFGVILPPGLAPGSGERRLGVKVKAQAPKKGQKLGLQSLLNYKWELAVDEETLSPQDFKQLLDQQSPLVEVNGKWLALQPSDVKAAQTLLKGSDAEMNLSVEDAVRLTSGESQTMGKLPIVDFEASGALQELITNLSGNQSLTPVATPQDFCGDLRPYQARGVSWLAFLQKWGLGGCLADDMGLGKCVSPETLIFLNGNLWTAEKIWEEFGIETIEDGEGVWAQPSQSLWVNSIDHSTNKIVPALITRLYRQQVQEKLRKIRLQDGETITITQQHKLLTSQGWTNQLQVGDYVAVPAKYSWEGKSVDLELVELIAWQMAKELSLNSQDQVIPNLIMNADLEGVSYFLCHYFKAKGSVNEETGSIEFASDSLMVMKQLSVLLKRFGIWLKVSQQPNCVTDGGNRERTYYAGSFAGNSARILSRYLGWETENKSNQTSQFEEASVSTLVKEREEQLFYSRIESIEEINYEGWVYDFEVAEHHNFIANNIICHNTIQTIALLLHLKEKEELNAPTLLVCPTSVLGNWEREVAKFSRNFSSLVHHGEKRKKGKPFVKQVQDYDLVITSYALAQRDATTLKNVSWEAVILDEAQNIKNPQAKQSKAVRELEANFRIALTGTPLENRLSELWSILDFLNPGYLGSQQFFQRRFATPIEKYNDRDSLQTLRSLVQPFILRRVKTDRTIIQDLPEKQEMNVYCGLSQEQAQLYQEIVEKALKDIEAAEGIKRHGKILTLLMKLKQLCNHPALLQKEKQLITPQRSGKLLRLTEMLEELTAENDRALIFTQFAEWGKQLKAYLEQHFHCNIPFLYGATRKQQREAMVDQFQNDPDAPPIFILSIKAGGTGLNLTRANHVFHVDRWWNPAVENQATDRAFRIGQKQNVQVHKFICTGTLEERINEMIESKKQLAEQTVDAGEDWLTQLDTEQLRDLVLLDRQAVMDSDQ